MVNEDTRSYTKYFWMVAVFLGCGEKRVGDRQKAMNKKG
jgi:hypothetical protein